MPRLDDLIVDWVKNASIPRDDKLTLLSYSEVGVNNLEVVTDKDMEPTKKEIRSLVYRLSSKAGAKPMRDDPGHVMPCVGTGTYVGDMETNNSEEHGKELVKNAIKAGFRMIDTARYYRNEKVIGEAIAELMEEGVIKRSDLFICTKVAHPNTERTNYTESSFMMDPEQDAIDGVMNQVKQSVEALGVECLDLVLLHWPSDFDMKNEELAVKKRAEMWQGLENSKEEGLCRSIGLSNFTIDHYEGLIQSGVAYLPAVNQIEVHPYLPNAELVEAFQSRGMTVMACCPLGSGAVLQAPQIVKIAEEFNVTPAQVILSWHAQRGIVPIPRTINPERMAENFAGANMILEFTEEHLQCIGELEDETKRVCPNPADLV
eukprot:TRINITY_DN2102_c0_g1_i1.p1 TRINITY_DN2102_c0_g1~~TRINITY_DN2102_c0_g1_i1.p1  ORF type:complete len:387 (+),score=138.24 TRINITY_DN2102_c0_g1_i1:42-1163(+)